MATIFVQLLAPAFGFAASTTVKTDDSYPAVRQLITSSAAKVVADPGGTLAVLSPGLPIVAAGAQAATATADAGSTDEVASLTIAAKASGNAAGVLATVVFGTPRVATPRYIALGDRSAVSAGLYVSARSAAGFTISTRSAPTASQAIAVDYQIVA